MKFHKNYAFINKCGSRTWAKMLPEDFFGKKKESRKSSRRSIVKKS